MDKPKENINRVQIIYNLIIIKTRNISLAAFNASKNWLKKLKQPKQLNKEEEVKKDDVKPADKTGTKAGDKTASAKLGGKKPAKADKTAKKTGSKQKTTKVVNKKTASKEQSKHNPSWPGRYPLELAWGITYGLLALLILLLLSLCAVKAINWFNNNSTLPRGENFRSVTRHTPGACMLRTNLGSIEMKISIPTNSSAINGQAFGNVVVTGSNSSNNGPRNTTLNLNLLSLPNLQGVVERIVIKTNVVYTAAPANQNNQQVGQNYDSMIRPNYTDDTGSDFSDLQDIPGAIDLVHDIEQRLGD